MRQALLLSAFIVSLLSVGVGYAASFVVTQGFWETRSDSIVTGFSGEGLVGTASGLGFTTPTSGDRFALGNTFALENLLVSDSGRFTVNGSTFPINAGSPSGYTLQLTGNPVTLPASFVPSLTLESPAILAGTLFLCTDLVNPCASHTVTGAGQAKLNFTGLNFPGSTPAYQFSSLRLSFDAAASPNAQLSNAGTISNPEPATLALLGSGLVGLSVWRLAARRKGSRG